MEPIWKSRTHLEAWPPRKVVSIWKQCLIFFLQSNPIMPLHGLLIYGPICHEFERFLPYDFRYYHQYSPYKLIHLVT